MAGIRADEERCRELLDRSTALATALSPYIGYAATADIAKTSVKTGRSIRELVRERELLPDDQLDAILSPEAMTSPGVPGRDEPGVRGPRRDHDETPGIVGGAAPDPGGRRRGAAPQHTRLFRPEDLGQLEPPDRDAWQRPDQIMDVLGMGDGSVVADLGAGSGWFTIRLAERVGPNGLVYAEDVQRQMIEAITRRIDAIGLKNVRTVLGTAERSPPPETGRCRADCRCVPRDGTAESCCSATWRNR